MKWRAPFVLGLFTLGALAAAGVGCGTDEVLEEEDEGAIIGGTPSGEGDNAVVALYRRGRIHCGATVIGRNVLLTAMHCVSDEAPRSELNRDVEVQGTLRASELEVYMDPRPGAKASALVSRIVVPQRTASTGGLPSTGDRTRTPIASNNIAILYVQALDPRFNQIRPLDLSTKPVGPGDAVTVIGYGGDTSRNGGSDSNTALKAPGQTYTPAALRGGQTSAELIGSGSSGYGNYNVLRERRSGVEVLLSAPNETADLNFVDRGKDVTLRWTNRSREFTTQAVACGGDSGGPAIDQSGRVVGIISAIVGSCRPGSLTTYTDVTAHKDFVRRALAAVREGGYVPSGDGTAISQQGYGGKGACIDDSYCGGGRDGSICDLRTGECMRGCRGGSVECGPHGQCSLESDPFYAGAGTNNYRSGYGNNKGDYTWGRTGICRSASGPGDISDPQYDKGPYLPPRGVTCPGDPRCTAVSTARECSQDAQCPAIAGRTRVCDTAVGRCLDGCRMGQPQPAACPQGQACGALPENPSLGACQATTVEAATTGAAPAAPPVAPAASPNNAPATVTVAGDPAGDGAGVNADPSSTSAKKKKSAAAPESSGCSVGRAPLGIGHPDGSSFGLMVLGLGVGLVARARRHGRAKLATRS